MSILFFRVIFKTFELFLFFYTKICGQWGKDKTKVLLCYLTRDQKNASDFLKKIEPTFLNSERTTRLLVVIPFRDAWHLTEKCLQSLVVQDLKKQIDMQICLVDNGSVQEVTFRGLEMIQSITLPKGITLKISKQNIPFNFSKLNNVAVTECASFAPEVILFLNNDIEFDDHHLIHNFVLQSLQLPQMGAVGCTLLYPNKKIQHLFLAPGVKLMGAHPLRGQPYVEHDKWYVCGPQPVAAVTGAALLVKTVLFQAVGGFDEMLAQAGQDLDLCLKLQKHGCINWVLPNIVMTHHETATRKPFHAQKDLLFLYQRWGRFLTHNSYYSLNLTRWSEQPFLSLGEGEYKWWKVTFKDVF